MSRRGDEKVAEIRARREAGYHDAVKVLAESLHAKFCDPDHEAVGGWDEQVILHVVREYEALPLGLHSCLLATLALEGAFAPRAFTRGEGQP